MTCLIRPIQSLFVFALCALYPLVGAAQDYPRGNVSLVVPYPVGGPSDAAARIIQPLMQQALGKPTIVENVAGAGGAIGAQKVLTSADGHLVLIGSPNEVILAPLANASARFKSEDFRIVGLLGAIPYVLVGRADLAPKDIDELIAFGRDPASKSLSYGSVGIGSLNHLAGEDFKAQTGVKMHHVPYKGGAPLVQDLIGGQIDIAFTPLAGPVLNLIETGKLRFYGVTTAARSERLKQLTTVNEGKTLKNFVYSIWVGPLVAQSTPDASVARLAAALTEAMKSPDVRKSIAAAGFFEMPSDAANEPTRLYQAEAAKFRKLAQSINLQAQ